MEATAPTLARQKHNNRHGYLPSCRRNVIIRILDATHLISRYARDFISFFLYIITSRYSCNSVILIAVEFSDADLAVIRERDPFIIAFNRLFACCIIARAHVCNVKPECLHG